MLSRRQGFSLVELMIVLGIIMLIFVATSRFLQNSETDQEKTIRFAELIHDVIRDARQDMIIGRGTSTWGTIVPIQKKAVVFQGLDESTSFRVVEYSPWQSSGTLIKEWKMPVFDGDNRYKIKQIQVSSGSIQADGTLSQGSWKPLSSGHMTLEFGSNGRATVQSSSDTYRSFQIEVEYKAFTRCIVGNATTGNSEVREECHSHSDTSAP